MRRDANDFPIDKCQQIQMLLSLKAIELKKELTEKISNRYYTNYRNIVLSARETDNKHSLNVNLFPIAECTKRLSDDEHSTDVKIEARTFLSDTINFSC